MTEKQIKAKIKKLQKQVNTLSSMTDLNGEVSINITIKESIYSAFELIQNRIIREVKIQESELNISLFFIWEQK
jgi:hypothetical protein